MTLSMVLAFLWFILANVLALLPSRDNHWTRAYILIALGVPLLGYLTYQNGALIGLIALAAGASILRWPVVYLGRWVKRVMGRES